MTPEQAYGRATTAEILAAIAAGTPERASRWEPMTAAFVEACRSARTVVDCGAEFGFYAALALRHAPAGVRVVAIEPDPSRAAQLRETFGARVEVHQVAVTDRAGCADALKPGPEISLALGGFIHPGGARLHVETVSLDGLLGDAPVDVLKMDIEGAETLAFAGMARLLARDHPALFVEFHPPTGAADAAGRAAVEAQLAAAGYPVDAETSARIAFGGAWVALRAVAA